MVCSLFLSAGVIVFSWFIHMTCFVIEFNCDVLLKYKFIVS